MRTILRLVAWLGKKAQDRLNAIEEREALAKALRPGTRVTLGKCRCRANHEGIWRIESYDVDANDYKIIREGDGAKDFARLDALEIVSVA